MFVGFDEFCLLFFPYPASPLFPLPLTHPKSQSTKAEGDYQEQNQFLMRATLNTDCPAEENWYVLCNADSWESHIWKARCYTCVVVAHILSQRGTAGAEWGGHALLLSEASIISPFWP